MKTLVNLNKNRTGKQRDSETLQEESRFIESGTSITYYLMEL